MNLDEIKYSISNIMQRKLRSALTVLSILIGVTAIYALVSFGAGLQNYISLVAEEAGVDKLFVQADGIGAAGADENFFLSQDDADFVDKVKGVAESSPLYVKSTELRKDDQVKYVFATGFDPKKRDFIEESFTFGVEKGRGLKRGDLDKVVLGYSHQFDNKVFKKKSVIGEKIEVNGRILEVVGFYEEVGNPTDDASAYVTLQAMELLFPDSKEKYAYIMVRANKNVETQKLADRITDRLRKHKDQEEGKEDFFVQTFEDALQTFNNIIGVLNGILFLIALISLIVASVNTMNTMYTAVVERTKEIGIMKAIGARNGDILLIFIFEAGFLGMLGGSIGVGLGFLISSAGGAIASAAGFSFLQPVFPLWLTAGCILFSFAVGAASGVLPAVQASKLKPVDALRYE